MGIAESLARAWDRARYQGPCPLPAVLRASRGVRIAPLLVPGGVPRAQPHPFDRERPGRIVPYCHTLPFDAAARALLTKGKFRDQNRTH
jgi:hypothetical protein